MLHTKKIVLALFLSLASTQISAMNNDGGSDQNWLSKAWADSAKPLATVCGVDVTPRRIGYVVGAVATYKAGRAGYLGRPGVYTTGKIKGLASVGLTGGAKK